MTQIIRRPNYVPAVGEQVSQTTNGFTVGQAIYYDGTQWQLAKADTEATLKMAVVSEVITADIFYIVYNGVFTWKSHGKTVGDTYYLSDTTAGDTTNTKPTTAGDLLQSVYVVVSNDTVRVVEHQFKEIGKGTSVGLITAYAGETTLPHDWLVCDGSAISRTTYPDLFVVIGTTYGVGDGSTTFNIPDLRGTFIRGWDNGRGVDAGRVFGSEQDDTTRTPRVTPFTATAATSGAHTHNANTSGAGGTHSHTLAFPRGGDTRGAGNAAGVLWGNNWNHNRNTNNTGNHTHTVTLHSHGTHTHNMSTVSGGDVETRPSNVALNYYIRTV